MEEKVLVTGAAGLIGRELCKQLSHRFDVTGTDNNFRYPGVIPECKFVKSNLSDFLDNNANNFKYIFHMSAINGTKYFYNIPNQLIENNITSDFSMFHYAKQHADCKLIYASSSEVVAGTELFPTPEMVNVSIENIHNPRWSYRLSKMVAENYLMNSNLNFLIVRFFNAYGPNSGTGHFIKDLLDKIERKDYTLVGADETRSFCRVEDSVDAVLNIFDRVSGEVINIGSNEEITILEAANILAQHRGVTVEWQFTSGNDGSVKRRRPDLTKLLEYYPSFDPTKFKEAVKDL
jgi:UDP-glucose 4-epimerase